MDDDEPVHPRGDAVDAVATGRVRECLVRTVVDAYQRADEHGPVQAVHHGAMKGGDPSRTRCGYRVLRVGGQGSERDDDR